jgi:hypothetical protein
MVQRVGGGKWAAFRSRTQHAQSQLQTSMGVAITAGASWSLMRACASAWIIISWLRTKLRAAVRHQDQHHHHHD